MTMWHVAEIVVRLKSDLHCGTAPLGFIARTLPFVPAHIPFYALVPVLVKKLNLPEYGFAEVEKFLARHIRFSPFFVLHNDELLFPWEKGLSDLEKYYLTAYYGVALDYNTRGALENRLFEKEVVASVPVKGSDNKSCERTELKGYVFWQEGRDDDLRMTVSPDASIAEISLRQLLSQAQWGGEVNKGLGRLLDVKIKKTEEIFYGQFVEKDSENPLVKWPGKKNCPFYLLHDDDFKMSGKLIPITGRRYDRKRGPGVKMDDVAIVWDSGWKTQTEESVLLSLDVRYVRRHKS
jgi:hypothetical protein